MRKIDITLLVENEEVEEVVLTIKGNVNCGKISLGEDNIEEDKLVRALKLQMEKACLSEIPFTAEAYLHFKYPNQKYKTRMEIYEE
jgi:hypothetical protein